MKSTMQWVRGSLAVAMAVVASLAAAAPKPSLVEPKLQVPFVVAPAEAVASLLMVIDGVEGAADRDLVPADIADLSKAAGSPPTVTFAREAVALPGTDKQARWLLTMTVKEMPQGVDLNRYVTFKLGSVDWTLPYRLVSAAATPTTWSLKPTPLSSQRLGTSGGALSVNVSVSGTKFVEGLGATVQLKNADGVQPEGRRFSLCAKDLSNEGVCNQALTTLSKPGLHQLMVFPSKPFDAGKYEGTLTVSSADKPDGESASLTVYVTSWERQLGGAALIAVGVIAALFGTTFLRHSIARNQMRLEAALLRTAIERSASTLAAVHPRPKTPEIDRRLVALGKMLTDSELEANGLPAALPLPGGTGANTGRSESFRQRIEAVAAWSSVLERLVGEGIVPMADLRARQLDPMLQQAAYDESIAELDKLAAGPAAPDTNAVNVAIRSERARYERALADNRAAPPSMREPAQRKVQTPGVLRAIIAMESTLAWAFVATVTILAGTYILVLANPGFGTCRDMLACLLWGLGLPAGTLLVASTTGSIASTLNAAR